jgi:putative oxidoreductase
VAPALVILFTVVATLIAHRFWEFEAAARATQQSAFKNLAIVGGYLVLTVSGGGLYSIDRLLPRRRGARPEPARRRASCAMARLHGAI